MSNNTVTIKFRAKLDDFAGRLGYKVPALTHSHVNMANRDTFSQLFMQGLNNRSVTSARLEKYAKLKLPAVIFADTPGDWTITPVGRGFTADVSITCEINI